MLDSKLQDKQVQKHIKKIGDYKYVLEIRFDNDNGNGCNDFFTTIDVYKDHKLESCGADLDLICKIFPEYAYLTKWHSADSNQPHLHYMSNSLYWWKNKNYDYFRKCAVWPEVTDEYLDNVSEVGLANDLANRKEGLMIQFKKDVESIGFI